MRVAKNILALTVLLGFIAVAAASFFPSGSTVHGNPNWPAKLVPMVPQFRTLPVEKVYSIAKEDGWHDAPWPFGEGRIIVACARPALNVVKVGTRYAALNGNTSGYAGRYAVEEVGGRRAEILTASSNHLLRSQLVFRVSAEDPDIGSWSTAINNMLLRECGS